MSQKVNTTTPAVSAAAAIGNAALELGINSPTNLELLETDGNTFWKVAREMDIENKLRNYGKNISLQGELIGEGIQGNPYKIKGQTVKFFNVFDIDNQE